MIIQHCQHTQIRRKQTPHKFMFRKIHIITKWVSAVTYKDQVFLSCTAQRSTISLFSLMFQPLGVAVFLLSVALVKTWFLHKILWWYYGELSFDISSTMRKNYWIYSAVMVKPSWKYPGTYRNSLFCCS